MNGTQDGEMMLFCSNDREYELNIPGSWFLPNGSKILSSSTANTQSLHTALGNQTVGLNIMNSAELPRGIYHCEMMDRENITHHLYAGIYPENEGIIKFIIIRAKNDMAR